ncbi:acyl carrier protein [Amycolatopsis sp. NPDC058278]|jgi:acyl carrier protein|uniref:acyl carrier protein n=1 Tax=Amycolatopsis sp. NPDC058278 TaxID=3346417 RepID=UPI0036DEF13E
MTTEEIREGVRTALAGVLGVELDAAQDDTPLADIAPEKYDSLGVLDCVAKLEQAFGISVDLVEDHLLTTFRSVGSITALIERKRHDAEVLGVFS